RRGRRAQDRVQGPEPDRRGRCEMPGRNPPPLLRVGALRSAPPPPDQVQGDDPMQGKRSSADRPPGRECRLGGPSGAASSSSGAGGGFFCFEAALRGTFPPSRRASERPIAIACFRLVTFLPERPERSLPRSISRIALSTFFPANFPYLAIRPPNAGDRNPM